MLFLQGLVATVLTVYGIETFTISLTTFHLRNVATVLTVYGIETRRYVRKDSRQLPCCNSTYRLRYWNQSLLLMPFSPVTEVATVLTVYGIETYLTYLH